MRQMSHDLQEKMQEVVKEQLEKTILQQKDFILNSVRRSPRLAEARSRIILAEDSGSLDSINDDTIVSGPAFIAGRENARQAQVEIICKVMCARIIFKTDLFDCLAQCESASCQVCGVHTRSEEEKDPAAKRDQHPPQLSEASGGRGLAKAGIEREQDPEKVRGRDGRGARNKRRLSFVTLQRQKAQTCVTKRIHLGDF